MKTFQSGKHTRVLVLARGEEVIESVAGFCLANDINAATFSAIGACGEVILSWYDLKNKKYEDHVLSESLEIANITGNIAMLEGKHIIHAHGTFARRDLSVVAGHLKKLVVSATCEITLEVHSVELKRAYDEETGLNLIS